MSQNLEIASAAVANADGVARTNMLPISATGLSKSYGLHQVFSDVSLTLEPGQVLGLIGRNGAETAELGLLPAWGGAMNVQRLAPRALVLPLLYDTALAFVAAQIVAAIVLPYDGSALFVHSALAIVTIFALLLSYAFASMMYPRLAAWPPQAAAFGMAAYAAAIMVAYEAAAAAPQIWMLLLALPAAACVLLIYRYRRMQSPFFCR